MYRAASPAEPPSWDIFSWTIWDKSMDDHIESWQCTSFHRFLSAFYFPHLKTLLSYTYICPNNRSWNGFSSCSFFQDILLLPLDRSTKQRKRYPRSSLPPWGIWWGIFRCGVAPHDVGAVEEIATSINAEQLSTLNSRNRFTCISRGVSRSEQIWFGSSRGSIRYPVRFRTKWDIYEDRTPCARMQDKVPLLSCYLSQLLCVILTCQIYKYHYRSSTAEMLRSQVQLIFTDTSVQNRYGKPYWVYSEPLDSDTVYTRIAAIRER